MCYIENLFKNFNSYEVPQWLSGLKIQFVTDLCGSGRCCGARSILGPGTSLCCKCGTPTIKINKSKYDLPVYLLF